MTERAITTDLRLGDWRDVLPGAIVDTLITDPPYGTRTHVGHDVAARDNRDGYSGSKRAVLRRELPYSAWTPDDVSAFVAAWSPRVVGWMAIMSCSQLVPHYEAAFKRAGRVSFAPVPCIIPGMTVRMAGDGPSNWAIYLNVSRPRCKSFARWGTLPGWYRSGRCVGGLTGGKPLGLMRQIVRDYSRPGDLVCDPCAGWATTLIAARHEGRSAIGAEVDPETHQGAMRRLNGQPKEREGQPGLFG